MCGILDAAPDASGLRRSRPPRLAFLIAGRPSASAAGRRNVTEVMRFLFAYPPRARRGARCRGVFVQHAERLPEQPVADRWQIEPLAREIGRRWNRRSGWPRPGARRDHTLHPAEGAWTSPRPAIAGARRPVELEKLAGPLRRDATVVAELPDAELFIRNDSLATADRDGRLQVDLSLGPFPHFVRDRVVADTGAQSLDLHEAVVVLDPFPSPNLGHFLLDQVSRLGVYEQAGADLARASRVGPAACGRVSAGDRRRVPGAGWLVTGRVARVRVRAALGQHRMPGSAAPGAILRALERWTGCGGLAGGPATAGRAGCSSRARTPRPRPGERGGVRDGLARHGFEGSCQGAWVRAQLAAFRAASHVVACHGAALAHLASARRAPTCWRCSIPFMAPGPTPCWPRRLGLRYAALVGRDGASDAPELNLPRRPDPLRGRFGERGLRIDPEEVTAWLAGAACPGLWSSRSRGVPALRQGAAV